MQCNILWIFVVAALGVCHCDDSTDDDSTDDSSFSSEESRCGGPPFNPRGFMQQKGWFYDKNRDECRVYYFGTNDWDDTKNKFQTVEQCRKTCRSGVPIYCFMKPNEGKRRESLPMFTYNSKNGLCVHVDITVSTDTHGTNVFRSDKKCNITCRDPELGKCAPSALNDCSRQESDTSYRFDVDSQTCREVEKGKCGPFTSLEGCSQRCGRYIPKKCHMPAVTSKYCDINETRYLYNSLTKKCEAVAGCADDNTNFRTARDCWMTCSSEQSSRCMKRPDLGRAGFGWTRFYYNITDNTCGRTTQIAVWQDTSKKNNFKSLQECMEMCKPTYKGDVKKI
uniref:Putative salivary kunitz domain protein n=1 Tax=Ixodes ricinus TaxID=34613 RepID=A0A0K8RMU4_IXORI